MLLPPTLLRGCPHLHPPLFYSARNRGFGAEGGCAGCEQVPALWCMPANSTGPQEQGGPSAFTSLASGQSHSEPAWASRDMETILKS